MGRAPRTRSCCLERYLTPGNLPPAAGSVPGAHLRKNAARGRCPVVIRPCPTTRAQSTRSPATSGAKFVMLECPSLDDLPGLAILPTRFYLAYSERTQPMNWNTLWRGQRRLARSVRTDPSSGPGTVL